jgi:HD superfamily phosphohydrolase
MNIPELEDYYKRTYGDKDDYHKLDDYVCELVKIAGLCHDLGHGPFSHLFDDVFVPIMAELKNDGHNPLHIHENRSCEILELIIKKDEYLSKIIMDPEIQFIKNLIYPKNDQLGFIYQIISNNFNAIDVDKFDYLVRDSQNLGLKFGFDYVRLLNDAKVLNDIICYPIQMYNEVSAIFDTRYRLHKQVYTHKVVISSQYMINDIMLKMEPLVKIYGLISNISEFHSLTDYFIIETVKFLKKNRDMLKDDDKKMVDEVYRIWIDLNERRMYKFIGSIVTELEKDISIKNILEIDPTINPDEIILHKSKIGFVSGKKSNPFDELYFYNNKEPNVCNKIKKEKVTFLISNTYQEYIYMFYVKNPNDKELIQKLMNIFEHFEKDN